MEFQIIFLNIYIVYLQALPYENVYGPLYGEEWLLMSGDDGYPHYVNVTASPNETYKFRGSVLDKDTYFHLYTRENLEEPEILPLFDNESTASRYFKPEDNVKVLTHGWLSSGSTDWLLNIKDAYLRSARLNVIAVDWSEMADNPVYPWAAFDTKHVGTKVARMLNALTNTYATKGSQMHLIGHSLGAQVMGYAGSAASENISRITGLDPARPLFEFPDFGRARRLDEGDADFVDIIHTCGGMYGYHESHGHADFYPNDGRAMQPGCEGVQYVVEGCSHGRSHQYYLESIGSEEAFISRSCESWANYKNGDCSDNPSNQMGANVDPTKLGDYYLITNAEPKYSQN